MTGEPGQVTPETNTAMGRTLISIYGEYQPDLYSIVSKYLYGEMINAVN